MLTDTQFLKVQLCERVQLDEPSEWGLDLILGDGEREVDVFVPFESVERGKIRHLGATIDYLQQKIASGPMSACRSTGWTMPWPQRNW